MLLALAVCLPVFYADNSFVMSQLEFILAMVMVSVGLNLVTGYAGQLSLGPGAVFGMAAYVCAVLANHFPTAVGLGVMCLLGIGTAVVVGLVVGMPALRVGGFYLGMVTFFFALAIPTVAANLSLTGGPNGISLVSNLTFTQKPTGTVLYEILVAIVAVLVLLTWLLVRSRVGRRLVALRTSEELTNALGISGYRTKLYAFVLSAIPAGLAGAVYVYCEQIMTPGSMSTSLSIYLVAACVIGGLGTVVGPVIGGAIVLGLSSFLGGLAQQQGIIFGSALIVVSVLIPDGIVGTDWTTLTRRLHPGRSGSMVRTAPTEPQPARLTAVPDSDAREPATAETQPRLLATSEATAAAPPLVAEHLRRAFGGTLAVEDVSLTVRRGSLHALIGPNGSGKTTVLNLISSFYRLDAGSVRIGDVRVDGRGPTMAARAGLGRTFQTPKLVSTFTALANVLLGAERDPRMRCLDIEAVFRLPRGRRAQTRALGAALTALSLVGVGDLADLPVSRIPHGGQRLVEIARAVSSGAVFLLLDEPAAGLSPREMDHLDVALRAIVRAGIGVLLVEHNLPFVLRVADEITVLDHGSVVAHGTPVSVAADPDVARVYIGQAPLTGTGGRVARP